MNNPVSLERVEKVWRSEWVYDKDGYLICSNCGFHPTYSQNSKDKKGLSNCRFCPNCGDAKTDEAVETVIERLETLNDDNLADRVIVNNDVQVCLSELHDILEAE